MKSINDQDISLRIPSQYRLYLSIKFFLIFSGIMILPWIGGIMDFFDPSKEKFDWIHVICVMPYILYALWLVRFFSRKIEIFEDQIIITGWINTKIYRYSEGVKFTEFILYVENHGTNRYQCLPHLFIGNQEKYE